MCARAHRGMGTSESCGPWQDLCSDMARVVGAFNAAIAGYADELLGTCKILPAVGQAGALLSGHFAVHDVTCH
eukprot:4819414-Amphidinium_carterae.1